MIHEFRIKNVLSFKEEQILSFEASTDNTYQDLYCVEIKPSFRLLKMGMIYGANASGKTNLLVALNILRRLVLNSAEDKFEKIEFVPFLLDENSKNENGEFYLSFFIGKRRFIYTLTVNTDYIEKEKLVYYPKSQPALVFQRTYDEVEALSQIEFGEKLGLSKKDAIILEGNTIRNSTLLSSYIKSNVSIDLLEDVIAWFKDTLMETIKPKTDLIFWTSKRIEESRECREFVLDALQKADLNISDIIIDEEEKSIDDQLAELIQGDKRIPSTEKEKLLKERKLKLKNISFMHTTSAGNFSIPYGLQSNGTQRYYGLGGVLSVLLQGEKILPIDELETSLHYELVNHFIKTFLVNSTNSQLIFTTHNINILSEDFIRRDVVWFCEKNNEGATELFSATDFGLHKNVSLFNAYRIGKLGAKPNPGDIFLENYAENSK